MASQLTMLPLAFTNGSAWPAVGPLSRAGTAIIDLTVAQPAPAAPSVYMVAKRTIDVAVATMALVALLPLFSVVALIIKLTSRGPVFFGQTRVGKDGKEFRFYKFRSMVVNAEQQKAALLKRNDHKDSITFKMKQDPRVTWIGRWIRRTSVDELPQLWSVLSGEMTLVGPRPAVPAEVAKYTPYQRRRLAVTPGLTCQWQVSGRGEIPFDQQVELDLDYIRNQSLRLDAMLLVKTVPAVLSGRGAY